MKSVMTNKEPQIHPTQKPFSEEVEKEREKKRTRELQPIFDELDDWRKKSLTAPLRI